MEVRRRPGRHQPIDGKSFTRLIGGIALIMGIMILGWYYLKDELSKLEVVESHVSGYHPEVAEGTLYQKPGFSLSYVDEYELPEWVAYELTIDMMNKPKHNRDQDFDPDPAIESGSGHYRDYKGSGYRRGHLVPSADMAWNKEAMDATFLLSNVAPMHEAFNDGIWLELEHNVRDWSRRYKKINVVTGPVFKGSSTAIGENQILVPRYFYKAVFTIQDGNPEVISFLLDQDQSAFGMLSDYVISIDSLEGLIGFDLFEGQYGSWEEEIKLEKRTAIPSGEWPFNRIWYDQRKAQGTVKEYRVKRPGRCRYTNLILSIINPVRSPAFKRIGLKMNQP